jgi:hypothetical protein
MSIFVEAKYVRDGDLIRYQDREFTVELKRSHPTPIETPCDQFVHIEGADIQEHDLVELLNPPIPRVFSLDELINMGVLETTALFGEYHVVGQWHGYIQIWLFSCKLLG